MINLSNLVCSEENNSGKHTNVCVLQLNVTLLSAFIEEMITVIFIFISKENILVG